MSAGFLVGVAGKLITVYLPVDKDFSKIVAHI
jgi:hypothetical protein